MTSNAYARLEKRFHRMGTLSEAAGMLHWDMAAVMPEGGHESRAEQLATLNVISHELLTAAETADLLAEAQDHGLDDWQRANLKEMRRVHGHATALTPDFVEASTKARAACEKTWREARPKGDFKLVLPQLQTVLDLTREAAAAKSAKLGLSPYDALMDEFEPGARAADITPIFDDYAAFLPEFLGRVLEHQKRQPAIVEPKGPFSIETQKKLGEKLMGVIGFDFNHGRLDTSLHPFCGGTPDDVRITTRYNEAQFADAMMGVVHETGHAMYERGLPASWRRQPVGQARGMALHESQSLIIEMQAARSPAFCRFLSPLLNATYAGNEAAFTPENLARFYTRVEPGFIRVSADEVTYPAHVILRYRLEQALIGGDLKLVDLPGAWNEGMQQLLGLTVTNDREGCLQDIHWFDGAFGYFPCYSLGAMTAAQFFAAATAAEPGIPAAIEQGDFRPLIGWLRTHVHARASSLSSPDIIKAATGRPLDAGIFRQHLARRYLGTA
ncbi:carboxypeptidase M32 [Dongia rigui]|uniref:Metal-dependent carboxypeptidase n=1 Tax=Dongia rigui TaxID=940149 RepID=A0ABU5DVP5_9PROT|nr:carboxypeptidase M32 [Dongia rigui]MDY0871386.1 carboxypeptidase M32 [Dongia rigui]